MQRRSHYIKESGYKRPRMTYRRLSSASRRQVDWFRKLLLWTSLAAHELSGEFHVCGDRVVSLADRESPRQFTTQLQSCGENTPLIWVKVMVVTFLVASHHLIQNELQNVCNMLCLYLSIYIHWVIWESTLMSTKTTCKVLGAFLACITVQWCKDTNSFQ